MEDKGGRDPQAVQLQGALETPMGVVVAEGTKGLLDQWEPMEELELVG